MGELLECLERYNGSHRKTYEIPIHITSQFVDGKIVKAFGYWDNSPIHLDAMAMQEAAEKAAEDQPK